MSSESSSPIFIHSLWRAGSTYLFQVFRRSKAGYYCYQEPLHEIALFNKDAPEKLLEYSGDLMQPLRHPALSRPYYQELYDTNRFWKDKIVKSDIYDAYFSSECSKSLTSFLKALIEHAQGRTVIQECRTSNRIGALKKSFGGTHLYLWRNPWDQWWSYKATDYFDMIQLLLVNVEDAPPVVKVLRQTLHFKQYHGETLQDEMQFFSVSRLSAENSYSCFYMLWCLALLEAQQHADFLLNIDQLSGSSVYKAEFLEIMGGTGISGLDFSDCRIHCTQFTQQDASFFKPLEDMVHELLLQYLGSGQVDAIKEAREKGMPESQKVLPESAAENVVLEDARRTREVVIRLETAFNNRMQQQLLLQEQLQQKISQQVEQQTAMAEQLRSDLKRQYDEHEKHLVLQYTDEKQAFNNLLKKYQEKAQSEAQLRVEQVAALDKQHNQEILEFQKTAKQENDELLQSYTMQLATLQQRYTTLERELHQKQLEAQARSSVVHREIEFSQRLQDLHQFADQEKQKLIQQFAEQLLTAEQQHAVRENALLQEQLVMQVRSAERERECSNQLESLRRLAAQEKEELCQRLLVMQARITECEREGAKQLQALQASYRQSEVAKEESLQWLLNQISDETKALYNSRWRRMGTFFGWLPQKRFERLFALLNTPFLPIEFAHQDASGVIWRWKSRLRILFSDLENDNVIENNLPDCNTELRSTNIQSGLAYTECSDEQASPCKQEKAEMAQCTIKFEAPSLKHLEQLNNTEFITAAYQVLLKRLPDPDGHNHFLALLQNGTPKVQILGHILESKEGKTVGACIPGLRSALLAYKMARIPVIGKLVRVFVYTEGVSHSERRLRIIEQELHRIGIDTEARLDRLEQCVNNLRHVVVHSGVNSQDAPKQIPEAAAVSRKVDEGGMGLSQRAQEIYGELKNAILLQSGGTR